jgi:UDP-3-O-[3-hydroxymyristoyl] glucosamine N-acyltransferase
MSDPVFHHRGAGLAVKNIAELTGARAVIPLTHQSISEIAASDRAGPHDITIVDQGDAERQLRLTQAGACFVRQGLADNAGPHTIALVVEDPYRAFLRVAAALYPDATRPSSLFEVQGRAPSALVHPTARVEAGVTIDPLAMVGPGAEIGSGTVIGPMVVVGPWVRLGRDCAIDAGASLTNALVGDRVSLGPGCRIGLASRGGVRATPDVMRVLGRAILQDKVVIGANSTVERGCTRDTILGEGTAVDPLVSIPADAVVGRYCRIVSAEGIKVPMAANMGVTDIDGVEFAASQLNCATQPH